MPFTQLVRLIDADPDLAEGLDPEPLAVARRHLVAEVAELRPDRRLSEVIDHVDVDAALGLLVLDGLVVRRVSVVGHAGIELIGSGDLVRPWQTSGALSTLPASTEWTVAARTRVAVLDEELQGTLSRFPSVLRALVARLAQRSDTLALNLVLAQLPRIEERLLVLFWNLADRFGRVESSGVLVPLPLGHSTLAELVYARRPSVTTALQRLASRGLIMRDRARGYVLHGDPRAEVQGAQRADRLVVGAPPSPGDALAAAV